MLIVLMRIAVKLKTNKRYHLHIAVLLFWTAAALAVAPLEELCCGLLCAVCRTLTEYGLILCFSCHVLHNSFKTGYPVVGGAAVLITGSVSPLGGKLCTTQHPLLILLRLLDR